MMNRFCLFLSLLNGFQAFAQISPEKLMATTEKAKWLKAEQSIRKSLAKDSASPEAPYLLSMYFFNARHTTFNIDSAHAYHGRAEKKYSKTSSRERERHKKIPLDSLLLMKLRTRIDSAAFADAKRLNSMKSYQYFITQYPRAAQRKTAVELRDEVAFSDALKINTWSSFQAFIQKYPSSHRRVEAQNRHDKLLYEDKTKDMRIASFSKFYEQYPGSPYRPAAEKNIFEIAAGRADSLANQYFVNRQVYNKYAFQVVRVKTTGKDSEAFLDGVPFQKPIVVECRNLHRLAIAHPSG